MEQQKPRLVLTFSSNFKVRILEEKRRRKETDVLDLCSRFINPVVVAPTVAAVGLAFFSYGFPQAGACVEISLPEILLILVFTLVSTFS